MAVKHISELSLGGGGAVEPGLFNLYEMELQEDVGLIEITLPSEADEVIVSVDVYKSTSNSGSGSDGYLYLIDAENGELGYYRGIETASGSGSMWVFKTIHAVVDGGMVKAEMSKQTSHIPTEKDITGAFGSYPEKVFMGAEKDARNKKIAKIKVQVWGKVFGTGTKIKVWYRNRW